MSEAAGVPRRTLGSGATLATLSQATAALTGGAMGIVVARLLGPAGTGELNLVLNAAALLTAVCSLGLGVGLNYHVSGGRWPAAAAVRQAQLAAIVLGAVAAGIGLGIWLALEGSAFRGVSLAVMALGVLAVPFTLSWTFSSYAALARDRYEAYAAAPAVLGVAMLLLAGALAVPFEVAGGVAGVTAAHAAVACGMLVWSLRSLGQAPSRWLREALGPLRGAASFGMPANLTNVLQLFNYRADLFILNAVASQATVGRYAIALSITAIGQLLPRALASVVLPRVAALDSGPEKAALDMVVVKSARHAVVIAAGTAVILGFGLLLVPLIYGEAFRGATELGLLLLPGTAFIAVSGVLNSTIVGKGRPRYSLYTVLMVTPPTLTLYALVVPELEAPGAAIVSSASYIATTLISLLYFKRVTGLEARALAPGRGELDDYRLLGRRLLARRRRTGESDPV